MPINQSCQYATQATKRRTTHHTQETQTQPLDNISHFTIPKEAVVSLDCI
jgi:hypothetical protein